MSYVTHEEGARRHVARNARPLVAAGAVDRRGRVHAQRDAEGHAKVPSVAPPIEARALLLLSPSFQNYGVQESNGIHKWRYRLGEAAAAALSDLVSQSFTR